MKYFILVGLIFLYTGCGSRVKSQEKNECVPCEFYGDMYTTTGSVWSEHQKVSNGFKWVYTYFGHEEKKLTNCIPCEKATTDEEKFVCFGKGKK